MKERFTTGDSKFCYRNNVVMRNYLDPTPATCAAPNIQERSTCYKPCPTGKVATGMICVDDCPATHPIKCGVMCAKDEATCFPPGATTNTVLDVFNAGVLVMDLMNGNAALSFLKLFDKALKAVDHFAHPYCATTAPEAKSKKNKTKSRRRRGRGGSKRR